MKKNDFITLLTSISDECLDLSEKFKSEKEQVDSETCVDEFAEKQLLEQKYDTKSAWTKKLALISESAVSAAVKYKLTEKQIAAIVGDSYKAGGTTANFFEFVGGNERVMFSPKLACRDVRAALQTLHESKFENVNIDDIRINMIVPEKLLNAVPLSKKRQADMFTTLCVQLGIAHIHTVRIDDKNVKLITFDTSKALTTRLIELSKLFMLDSAVNL